MRLKSQQSEANIASLHQTYAADDVNQGIQILRDYISHNWEDRWSPVAGDLAPYPRPRLFGPKKQPLFLPGTPTPPSEPDIHAGAGPSHQQPQPQPQPSQRKRGRGTSRADATSAPSPSQVSPPSKRVTRSKIGPEGSQADESAPIKIGHPTRSARLDKGKAKDAGGAAGGASAATLRRSSRNATKQQKDKTTIGK